jgi:hypothetical protein
MVVERAKLRYLVILILTRYVNDHYQVELYVIALGRLGP